MLDEVALVTWLPVTWLTEKGLVTVRSADVLAANELEARLLSPELLAVCDEEHLHITDDASSPSASL